MSKELSPSKKQWKRFASNFTGMAGLICIVLMVFVAFFSPFIRKDTSKNANQQNLIISKQKPGFSTWMLIVKSEGPETSIIQRWMQDGTSEIQEQYPITSLMVSGDTIKMLPFGESDWNFSQSIVVANNQFKGFGKGEWRNYEDQNLIISQETYLLGTDKYGRDLMSRLISGSRISLLVGFIAVLISLIIGITLGGAAGYYDGRWDQVISWFINVVWSIPTLLMVIAITLAFGKGFWQVFIAVGLTMWVEVARIVRGQFLVLKKQEYIEAAKVLGFSSWRIMFKHMLPNALGPIIVVSAANFAAAILIEAGLSFLGVGAQIPTPSWGNMIKEHYALITTDLAYLALVPGIMIMILVLAFMLAGNALRDAMDGQSTS
ncbi:MAG: ABC transporter permease [Flavobacteriales bacterium]|nr:ABC transporter permease [Flavobacteriales bacterium]